MKRLLVAAAAVAVAFACAQQQERVRKASEASAEAQKSRGPDAGVAAATAPVADAGTRVAAPATAPAPTPAPAPAPTRAAAPAPAVSEAPRPAPTITQLPSGAGLLVLPLTTQAIVDIELRFRTGAVDDPPGKTGLTVLTARVMSEGGTKALDAKSLLNALFPLAADLGVRVDKEQTTFIARVHRDNLAKFLPIVTDVLLHPRWDPQEFKRLREAAVNDVEKRLRQGDDENLGKESLSELMYRDHPYGRLTLGHLSDLKSMISNANVPANYGAALALMRATPPAGPYGWNDIVLPDRRESEFGYCCAEDRNHRSTNRNRQMHRRAVVAD